MVSDRVYKVNIKRLALLTLPTWLRKPLVGALIYAGVTPLARLLQDLRSYRATTSYRLSHNGQVCKLRAVLNDEFDPELRRITIEDKQSEATKEADVIYQRDVGRWIILPKRSNGSVITHRRGFIGTSGYDFWVNVPSELKNEQTTIRMEAIINTYKLASKRFTIKYI